ncbi:MAG: hypothetical protein GTN99_07300 [Candidatus Dadabacteria bacterium]|nr:hypothetical protein [Candidatus Dadabacteria bacterium]
MDNKVIRIVHQCGENDYEDVLERYSRYNLDVSVYKFIDNIEDYYADADIVIARSGAGTLAEICSVGVASVLIPYPFATHNHQYHNALVLEQSHAAILIEESDLNAKELASQVSALLDRAKLKEMASRAKALGKPRASGAVVENMYKILNMKPCMGV